MSKKAEIALTAAEQLLWDAKAKVRVLLNLWNEGEGKSKVNQGKLTKLIARTNENKKTYEGVLKELEEAGAIAYLREKGRTQVELTAKGKQVLAAGLKSQDSLFEFDGSQMGARLGNALLKWMRHEDGATGVGVEEGKGDVGAIASYEEFKPQALALFEKLEKDFNTGLVPIWHLRRELGEKVSRENFRDWIMQIQADGLFYLQSGEARGATDEQKRDSISDDVRGLLFFVSKPS